MFPEAYQISGFKSRIISGKFEIEPSEKPDPNTTFGNHNRPAKTVELLTHTPHKTVHSID
jgi:hypothetical protein